MTRRSYVRLGSLSFLLLLLFATLVRADSKPSGWLGVRMQSGGPGEEGVRLVAVIADSPAHRAGLRARDLVLAVDGAPVRSAGDLAAAIGGRDPGAWIPISLVRGDDELDVRLRLGERPEHPTRLRSRRGWVGVGAIAIPASLRAHFGAPEDSGVMISHVDETSPAEAAGIELGDVVFEVGGEPVPDVGSLHRLISGAGIENEIEIKLARRGLELVVEAIVEEAAPRSAPTVP